MSLFESQFAVGDQAYIFTDIGTCVLTTIDTIIFTPGAPQNMFDPETGFTYVTTEVDVIGDYIKRPQYLTFADKTEAKAYIDSIV